MLLHNLRADAPKRLGIGHKAAKQFSRKLIYCSAIALDQG